MEKYDPHVDYTNEEGRKAAAQLISFEEKMLARPFSELSHEELITVRDILLRRKKAAEHYNESLALLADQKTDERAKDVTKDVLQAFYDMGHKFDKTNPESTDLEIVEGLIRKAEEIR